MNLTITKAHVHTRFYIFLSSILLSYSQSPSFPHNKMHILLNFENIFHILYFIAAWPFNFCCFLSVLLILIFQSSIYASITRIESFSSVGPFLILICPAYFDCFQFSIFQVVPYSNLSYPSVRCWFFQYSMFRLFYSFKWSLPSSVWSFIC